VTAGTTKDFGPIQDDYAFFEDHSTEAAADAAAYLPHVRQLAEAGRAVRLLDFGCGSGRFTARLLSSAGFDPRNLRLTLVEPVEDYRRQAAERLTEFTAYPIETSPTLSAGHDGSFDLVLANHCLYYVPDLEETLTKLLHSRVAGGRLLGSCAGLDNLLIKFWRRGYKLLNRPVPHHIWGDVASVLTYPLMTAFSVEEVRYELTFDDTEENRSSILRFLFGADFPALPRAAALGFFDPYTNGGQVRMDIVHEQFLA
jgi:SAM-dependent methyltransferase